MNVTAIAAFLFSLTLLQLQSSSVDRPFPAEVLWSPHSSVISVSYDGPPAIEIAVTNERNQVLVFTEGLHSGISLDVVRIAGGPLTVYVTNAEKLSAVIENVRPGT